MRRWMRGTYRIRLGGAARTIDVFAEGFNILESGELHQSVGRPAAAELPRAERAARRRLPAADAAWRAIGILSSREAETMSQAFKEELMKRRHFALVLALALVCDFSVDGSECAGPREALHCAGNHGQHRRRRSRDVQANQDAEGRKHPHGQAAPKSQDKLYMATEDRRNRHQDRHDQRQGHQDDRAASASSRRTGRSLRTAASCISRRTPATGRCSTRRRKRSSNTSTRWASGTTRVMSPDGSFVYLLPIAGGQGHLEPAVARICPGRSPRK